MAMPHVPDRTVMQGCDCCNADVANKKCSCCIRLCRMFSELWRSTERCTEGCSRTDQDMGRILRKIFDTIRFSELKSDGNSKRSEKRLVVFLDCGRFRRHNAGKAVCVQNGSQRMKHFCFASGCDQTVHRCSRKNPDSETSSRQSQSLPQPPTTNLDPLSGCNPQALSSGSLTAEDERRQRHARSSTIASFLDNASVGSAKHSIAPFDNAHNVSHEQLSSAEGVAGGVLRENAELDDAYPIDTPAPAPHVAADAAKQYPVDLDDLIINAVVAEGDETPRVLGPPTILKRSSVYSLNIAVSCLRVIARIALLPMRILTPLCYQRFEKRDNT